MIPFFDITTIEPVFGFEVEGEPVPPPIPVRVSDIFGMIPFPDTFYHDEIQIERKTIVDVDGSDVLGWLAPGPVEPANVQTHDVERIDPGSGALAIVTRHIVRTPTNRALMPDDHILYRDNSGVDHVLNVVAPSIPVGNNDVAYLTECVEVV
jgi:hypothetical protein